MRPCQRTGGLKSAIMDNWWDWTTMASSYLYSGYEWPNVWKILPLGSWWPWKSFNVRLDRICSQKDVIPICMPAQFITSLTASWCGLLFTSEAGEWPLAWEQLSKAGRQFNHIDKFYFLEAYPQAHTKAFITENIKNSFAASGLVPFNPETVLGRLKIYSSQGLYTTGQPIYQFKTSQSRVNEKANIYNQKLLRQLAQSPSSPTKSALNQLVRVCETAMNSAIIFTKENQDLRAAHEKQTQRGNGLSNR